MKSLRATAILAIVLFLGVGVSAQEKFRQTRINLTIRVPEFGQAAEDLREATAQIDASIESLNLQIESSSGNATVRVNPEQLSDLVGRLTTLGRVENQSQSVNDFTQSYAQYQERLKTYQSLRGINLKSAFDKLPPKSRGPAYNEYVTWVQQQIDNSQSNMQTYLNQTLYAEVYINFVTEPTEAELASAAPAPVTPPPAEKPGRSAPSMEFLVLCFINIMGLWVIYRKLESTQNQVGLKD